VFWQWLNGSSYSSSDPASVWYLGEVVEGLVQVGVHASRWFIGDLDGVLQDALRDDVALGGGGGLCTYKHPEVFVASLCVLFQKLLQRTQPASHQVDVLQETGSANKGLKRRRVCYRWAPG